MTKDKELISIRDLTTYFFTYRGVVKAVEGVSFGIRQGEVVGIVGETGSGKSVTALSLLRLISAPGRILRGEVVFKGEDILRLPEPAVRENIRGREITMIFQKPMSSLNPVFTIGRQLADVIRLHQNMRRPAAQSRAIENMKVVALPDPEEILRKYPHELSGGEQQRVMIAMALGCGSSLLIADEPTTALDVSVQLQILKLMRELQKKTDISILLISHDLGVIANICDRVNVMYAGTLVESGPLRCVIDSACHPYSVGLISSVLDFAPRQDRETLRGEIPDLLFAPSGCRFHPRCAYSEKTCQNEQPRLIEIEPEHRVACHLFRNRASVRA